MLYKVILIRDNFSDEPRYHVNIHHALSTLYH
jgi:hypothetical protein